MKSFRLPYPPSVNNYYAQRRQVRCFQCKGMVKVPPNYLTKHAKEYRKGVARRLIGEERFGDSLLAMRVDWYPSTDSGDIDNRIKPLLDAIEDSMLFNNDKQIKDLRVVWQHPVPGGYAEVKIWRI